MIDGAVYAKLTPTDRCTLVGKIVRKSWLAKARPEQLPFTKKPDAKVSIFCAGRGSGKSFAASNWMLTEALLHPNSRCGILAPSFGSGEGTCIYGTSGMLSILPDPDLADYHSVKKILTFANGSKVRLFSSEHRRDMRGPEFTHFWCEEMADLSHGMECFQLFFPAVRLKREDGEPSRIYFTGTPRANDLVLHLMDRAESDTVGSYEFNMGGTHDNIKNLDETTVKELEAQYAGTRYYLQEMEGILLREAENALWTQDTISSCHRRFESLEFDQIAIGVDPAVSSDKKADHTGLILGARLENQVYILDDFSERSSPLQWARKLAWLVNQHSVGAIVYEKNLAGPLIRDVLDRALDEMNAAVRLIPVQAVAKKHARAEPIAALYEAKRVLHMPPAENPHALLQLEKQMTTWEPTQSDSPDRIDALVHLVRFLLLGDHKTSIFRAGGMPWAKS